MLKKLENLFIWAADIAFMVAAVCTLFAFIVGIVVATGKNSTIPKHLHHSDLYALPRVGSTWRKNDQHGSTETD